MGYLGGRWDTNTQRRWGLGGWGWLCRGLGVSPSPVSPQCSLSFEPSPAGPAWVTLKLQVQWRRR